MKDLENIKLGLNEKDQLILTAIVDGKEASFFLPSTPLLNVGNFDDVEIVDDPEECPDEGPNEDEKPEVEEEVIPTPKPENEYKVWVKDSLWGKDFEVSSDEWTWTHPTEHAYDVYIEGPKDVKVYPEIERGSKIYTTKADLTSRGTKIGFNKLQSIPMILQGTGTKTLIGKAIGPGSASAKGYKGILRFKDENGNVLKEISMRYI